MKTNLTRLRGWSPRGERLIMDAPFGSWGTQTFIAGLTADKMFAPWVIKGGDGRLRFGYRRLHILLKREGWHVNWKKLDRIYREEGLTVRKRGGRKRAVGTRAPMAIPQGPNQRPLSVMQASSYD